MLRIADSLAYVAAARHVYVVVEIPRSRPAACSSRPDNLSTDKKALSYDQRPTRTRSKTPIP